jgi:hypothetical protein
MSSDLLQTLLVGLIVLAALAFVGRRAWRTLAAGRAKNADGCGGDCGCH